MLTKPASCEGCPAFEIGRSFVPGEGPPNPKAILLGQGPGRDEALTGRPFIGPSGRVLDRWFRRVGLPPRGEWWIDNTVRCWLPKDRAPLSKEVAFCRQAHWGLPLVERLNSKLLVDGTSAVPVLLLGTAAAKAIIGPQAGEGWNGSLELVELTQLGGRHDADPMATPFTTD